MLYDAILVHADCQASQIETCVNYYMAEQVLGKREYFLCHQ